MVKVNQSPLEILRLLYYCEENAPTQHTLLCFGQRFKRLQDGPWSGRRSRRSSSSATRSRRSRARDSMRSSSTCSMRPRTAGRGSSRGRGTARRSQDPRRSRSRTSPGARSGGWRPTDANGRFTVDGLPAGRVVLTAMHPENVTSAPASLSLVPGVQAPDVEIIVEPGTVVSARTLNEAGYPIRDAHIAVYDADEELLAEASTGTDGFAEIKGLPGRFRVVASSDGVVSAAASIQGRQGERVELCDDLAHRGQDAPRPRDRRARLRRAERGDHGPRARPKPHAGDPGQHRRRRQLRARRSREGRLPHHGRGRAARSAPR